MTKQAALCANCDTTINGKYCHECGQKATIGRLSMHELFHELWHALTHTDKGILKLIKDLFVYPRAVYENYFEGQRKRYFSPVLLFLVSAGILAYLYPFVFDYDDKVNHNYNSIGREVYHLTKYRALILLPVQAILTWMLFRRRFNLAEVTAFWLFCLGFIYTIKIILLPLYFPLIHQKHNLDNVFVILGYLVILWHSTLVFAHKKFGNFILLLLITNIFFVLESIIQFYMIFGNHVFTDPGSGVKNICDLVVYAYKW